MKILIVEDVTLVAERIEHLVRAFWKQGLEKISLAFSLEQALSSLRETSFDLVFLDLNLNGKNGFQLLTHPASQAFKTIVITANEAEAANAFDLGVFDFIRKPITAARFNLALTRLEAAKNQGSLTPTCLAIRSRGRIDLVRIENINYIKAAKNYTELCLRSGEHHLHDRNINQIQALLPASFVRIHRSYITDTNNIKGFINHGAGKYEVALQNGVLIPINRDSFKRLASPSPGIEVRPTLE